MIFRPHTLHRRKPTRNMTVEEARAALDKTIGPEYRLQLKAAMKLAEADHLRGSGPGETLAAVKALFASQMEAEGREQTTLSHDAPVSASSDSS